MLPIYPFGEDGKPRLKTIVGMVPNVLDFGQGCRFHERCFSAQERCLKQDIDLMHSASGTTYRCLFPNDVACLNTQSKRPSTLVFGDNLRGRA